MKRNKYPIYIISKSRYECNLTSEALARCKVAHYVVVEKSQRKLYEKFSNRYANIIVLPKKFLKHYETYDKLGSSKSKGPGAARNFCIVHSRKHKFKRHWVMDDNIRHFYILNNNAKIIAETSSIFRAAEDFVDRYKNVPVSGFNYDFFCKASDNLPPFILNTRIYSCLLIDNNAGFYWKGRYNEDTDLSLRVLKDKQCTIQFNMFLAGKLTTQILKGGNTEAFYSAEGTLPKSKMLEDIHPDVAKVVWKFNRWHHHVDYTKFKNNKLRFVDKTKKYKKINNYGIVLKDIQPKT